MAARQYVLDGHVQGVGFRPFVFRLAEEIGLRGEVRNNNGTVHIIAEGSAAALDDFERRLIGDAPPLASPRIVGAAASPVRGFAGFFIAASETGNVARIYVPADHDLCADCASEMADPANRRFRYPFINCTQCGPRYTLITAMPYDRPNTSMRAFPMCAACESEYHDPANRRFHAEPVACPDCGPRVSSGTCGESADAALGSAICALRAGRIVAVRGIGGYHLLCDARNERAVSRLRQRKQRPDKPLAVMFPCTGAGGVGLVSRYLAPTPDELLALTSAARPIVLMTKRADCPLAENVAPALSELGVFLPYSPLHRLLLDDFGAPLVATSGNISGEPVLTNPLEAAARLAGVADIFLHHDREIVRPADDSLLRRIAGRVRPLRIGRGLAPLEMELPFLQDEPLICLGGQMKATVALSWERRVVVSPHIGEMANPRSFDVLRQVIDDLQSLYGVRARRVVCDAHPGYVTHRWAMRQNELPASAVQHHRAHASALAGEFSGRGPWLVFTWDGVGLGEDRTLWGGEALLGEPGAWRRVCSLRPFRPPGGDRAAREPWRNAAALLWAAGRDLPWTAEGSELAHAAWQRRLNCPPTSAAGRLFDAAAALVCGLRHASFEAQGPMRLEALCRGVGEAVRLPLYLDVTGVLRSDWQALLARLTDSSLDPVRRAEDFHSSMARVLVDQACAIRNRHDVERVGLTGGVFQNRILADQAVEGLTAAGFEVRLPRRLPCNDAGLCFGQAVETAAQARRCS